MDLRPQLHATVTACGASLTEEWLLTCFCGQSVPATKPTIIGAVNGVELEECAVSAVTAHLTASLAFAVNVTVTIFPQPVSAQAVALWHTSVVVFRQERCKVFTKCVKGSWVDERTCWIRLPAAHRTESSLNWAIQPVLMIQVQATHQDNSCSDHQWPGQACNWRRVFQTEIPSFVKGRSDMFTHLCDRFPGEGS